MHVGYSCCMQEAELGYCFECISTHNYPSSSFSLLLSISLFFLESQFHPNWRPFGNIRVHLQHNFIGHEVPTFLQNDS